MDWIIIKSLVQEMKSFIEGMNSREPIVDPWGTPKVLTKLADFSPSICTYCDLLETYDLKLLVNLEFIPLILFFLVEFHDT